ncbi:GIY-YIG nuclease family protein [Thermosipho ferrireducens]|uniref:GIY-YIG nuclease family protein n=1 Tax=Thermosipho ferrireducens TaxID=2571116 RepID=A0ABX7SAV3_9BACT|nr:GIY-YIG nuclease family protein [Thermosipho ferrireducens]QTA38460.1 GIY-YIG nuclease family protein [Thermosipho ferrireducens]
MDKKYFLYILTNWNNKVMYIGITNNLQRRVSVKVKIKMHKKGKIIMDKKSIIA